MIGELTKEEAERRAKEVARRMLTTPKKPAVQKPRLAAAKIAGRRQPKRSR
jgi:hypothetical protein